MTWFVTDTGYELFFNRDERLTRRRAKLPSVQTHHSDLGNLAYISPTDADAGGTWIAANELGITVALLNHYQFEQIATYKNWISRGVIVRNFSSMRSLKEARLKFAEMALEDYRAFRMFMIDASGENCLMVWDGHTARIENNVTMPKSSSSVDAKNVKASRKQLFVDMNLVDSRSATEYVRFHASHEPDRSQNSVCMHRQDAKTVSLSHIKVDRERIAFSYADGSPCEVELSEPVVIELSGPTQQEKRAIAI